MIRSFANVDLTTRIVAGSEVPPQGWVSPHYGQRRPAPVMIVTAETRLPLRIITLLVPAAGEAGAAPEVSLLDADARRPSGLVLDRGRDTLRFEDDAVVVNGRRFPEPVA
jgi:hypothetical protein